jgi:hypothetical protein
MTLRSVVASLILSLLPVTARPDGPVRGGNAAADSLKRWGVELGLDFDPGDRDAAHPSMEERRATSQTGYFAWLNGELGRSDDAISDPPQAFREYLRTRREALSRIVSVLEKGPPQWPVRETDETWAFRSLLATVQLERILLAMALCEERDDKALAASRTLEAAWSLGRPAAEGDYLIHQTLAVGIGKLQAGALRKIRSPSSAWLSRLDGDEPSLRMFAAVERESERSPGRELADFHRAMHAMWRAAAERLQKLPACDAVGESDGELWRGIKGEFENDSSAVVRASAALPPRPTPEANAEPDEEQPISLQDELQLVTDPIRRAARLRVDRELTRKILELRMQADASANGEFPAALPDGSSRVCPGSTYSYRRIGAGMEIRFDGAVESAGGEPLLPLSFRAGASKPRAASETAEQP